MAFQPLATLTSQARVYRAQELTVGIGSVVIHNFSVGTGGYDPLDNTTALAPDPNDAALINQIFVGEFAGIEWLNAFTPVFVCTLLGSEAIGLLGEVGLWAEVLTGPDTGLIYLHAILHIPAYPKISGDTKTFKFVLPA